MQKKLVLTSHSKSDENASVTLTPESEKIIHQLHKQAILGKPSLNDFPNDFQFSVSVIGKMPGVEWFEAESERITVTDDAVAQKGYVRFNTEEFQTPWISIPDIKDFFRTGKISPTLQEMIYDEAMEPEPDEENDGFITEGLGGAYILHIGKKYIGSFPDLDTLLENLPDDRNTFYQALWISDGEVFTRIDEQGNPLGTGIED